ncbi:MAG: hypothetical protein HKN42_06945 [Granulosicoccus sp.]|nr:hypothetical protein [Granulosicoccus sp.]
MEYTVITAIIVMTLFVPVPGLGHSVIGMLMSSLVRFQANSTYLLSMP